jgi:hypothetical protein
VIVAYGYGWVPKNGPTNDRKSITWLAMDAFRPQESQDLLTLLASFHASWYYPGGTLPRRRALHSGYPISNTLPGAEARKSQC